MGEVVFRTEYTVDNELKFFRYNIFNRNKGVVIGFCLIYAALFIFNMVNIVGKRNAGKSLGTVDFVAIAVVIFCAYWIFSRFFIMPKKMAKANAGKTTVISDITVTEKGLSICLSGNSDDDRNVAYEDIYKVYETDDFFYVFVDKNYAYMIDKKGVVTGTAECARAMFVNHCTKKQFKNGTKTV